MKVEGSRQQAKSSSPGTRDRCKQVLGYWLSAIGYSAPALPGRQIANLQSPMANLAMRLRAVRAAGGRRLAEHVFRRRISRAGTNFEHTGPRRGHLSSVRNVAVLAAASGSEVGWSISRARARLGALSIFSVLYFGFWRKGCVCAIGSLQNVALGLCDGAMRCPWRDGVLRVAIGVRAVRRRTFCAAVCRMARCRISCCSSR